MRAMAIGGLRLPRLDGTVPEWPPQASRCRRGAPEERDPGWAVARGAGSHRPAAETQPSSRSQRFLRSWSGSTTVGCSLSERT